MNPPHVLLRSAGRNYAQRKGLSEAPNGWIKEVLGFRRFSLRELTKVRGEWDLVCLALNVKRMQRLLGRLDAKDPRQQPEPVDTASSDSGNLECFTSRNAIRHPRLRL